MKNSKDGLETASYMLKIVNLHFFRKTSTPEIVVLGVCGVFIQNKKSRNWNLCIILPVCKKGLGMFFNCYLEVNDIKTEKHLLEGYFEKKMEKISFTQLFFYFDSGFLYPSQLGPGVGRIKLNDIKSPIWTFYFTQRFSFPWSAKFLKPGVRGLGWRTFPELVWRSVQNLVEIGLAVCTWKRDIGTYM